ncbi:Fe-S cluster assembly sulfur transfer protein SufU [Planctomycetota bacterium]
MDLRELYQQVILDHNRAPRNYRKIENASREVEGDNPLCGDRYTVYVELEGDVIRDVAFEGSGCAISKASASLMTDSVKGLRREAAEALFKRFHCLVTGAEPEDDASAADLGRLEALAGVRAYPVRVKCASLAWHALAAALRGDGDAVSTE